jgi:uncharacterized membrane protein YwaF
LSNSNLKFYVFLILHTFLILMLSVIFLVVSFRQNPSDLMKFLVL